MGTPKIEGVILKWSHTITICCHLLPAPWFLTHTRFGSIVSSCFYFLLSNLCSSCSFSCFRFSFSLLVFINFVVFLLFFVPPFGQSSYIIMKTNIAIENLQFAYDFPKSSCQVSQCCRTQPLPPLTAWEVEPSPCGLPTVCPWRCDCPIVLHLPSSFGDILHSIC